MRKQRNYARDSQGQLDKQCYKPMINTKNCDFPELSQTNACK